LQTPYLLSILKQAKRNGGRTPCLWRWLVEAERNGTYAKTEFVVEPEEIVVVTVYVYYFWWHAYEDHL